MQKLTSINNICARSKVIRGVVGTFSYKGADFQLLSASAHDSSARTLVFNSIQRGVHSELMQGATKFDVFSRCIGMWSMVKSARQSCSLGRIMFKLRQFNSSDLSFLGTEALYCLCRFDKHVKPGSYVSPTYLGHSPRHCLGHATAYVNIYRLITICPRQ